MINFRKPVALLAAAASVVGLLGSTGAGAETIRAVMNSDLKILDPIWTTAYVQRGFGYLVWDTLFALDEKLQVQPQMVDKWEVSPDKLTWTFTLRDGLVWSDGTPVTSEDCIQSIKRWGARDSMGQKMLASVVGFEAADARTFKMKMKEPYGLVLESLGKPSSNVPFMMPKRVAETDPFTQIKAEDVIGSGPFIFVAKEWKPGEKVVFVKNPTYKPRAEPPSGLAGGKTAKVDRLEWIWIPDAQTQVAALQSGEVDMLEQPTPDLLPLMAKDKNLRLLNANPLGNQYALRFNTLFKPFDNPKIRHAAMVAFNQEDFLKATIGPDKGGWSAFITSWGAADILNPVSAAFFNASCDKALFGWPCDETIEKLRDQFSKESDPARQKQIAVELQKYWVDHPTHVHLGEWYQPIALRADIEGVMIAPATAFWNMSRKK